MSLRRGQYRPSGLVAEWNPGNGLATTRAGRVGDRTLNGNHGEIYGRPVLSFDGVSDKITIDTPFDVFGGHRYAICAFNIYCDSSNSTERQLYYSNWSTGSSSRVDIHLTTTDKLELTCRGGSVSDPTSTATSTKSIPQDEWLSLLVAVDIEDDKVYVWLNGEVFEVFNFDTGFSQNTFAADVPQIQWYGLFPSVYKDFSGYMKNLGIKGTNTIPTLADVRFFHENPERFLLSFGFDAAYLVNEGISSTKCIDLSGNNHHATVTGASWVSNVAAGGQTWVKGRSQINDASWVDPTDDRSFTVDDGSIFSPGDVIRVRSELLLVDHVSTNTLYFLSRGYLGTTPETLADNDVVYIVGDRFGPDGMFFDGTTHALYVPHSTDFDFGVNQDFSFVAWVLLKGTQYVSWPGLITKGICSISSKSFAFGIGNYRNPMMYIANGTTRAQIKADTYVTLNEMHMLGFTADRDGNGQMYVDGVPDGPPVDISAYNVPLDDTGDIAIGSWVAGSYFVGPIKRVQVFKRALSAGEIQALYDQGVN